MTPPSARTNGGSSLKALFSRSFRSSSRSSRVRSSTKRAAFRRPSTDAIAGSRVMEPRREVSSRGLAVPTVILLNRRSRSKIPANDVRVSSSSMADATNSPTASRRNSISFGSMEGRTSQFRSSRAPIPVRVRLITANKVSLESPLDDSKSSKLRIVAASSTR